VAWTDKHLAGHIQLANIVCAAKQGRRELVLAIGILSLSVDANREGAGFRLDKNVGAVVVHAFSLFGEFASIDPKSAILNGPGCKMDAATRAEAEGRKG
jgi:hypothetical protein